MTTSLFPQPVLSGVLLVTWLLLSNSASPGHILLGGLLGWLIPLLTQRFWPHRQMARRPLRALRLLAVVLWDIAVANLAVARLILGEPGALRPGFVWYPLTLRGDFPITVLSSIISLTPGTVVMDVGPQGRRLLIHSLDCADGAALIQQIRTRYEMPLQEIFPCSPSSSPSPSP